MPIWKQKLLTRYCEPAGDGGSKDSGTGAGDGGDAAAIAAAAAASASAAAAAAAAAGKSGDTPKPSDAEAKLLKEVMQKKEALATAAAESAALKESLKAYEGIDPVAVRALIAEKKDAETKSLEAAGNWNSLKERMSQEHTVATAALQTDNETLRAALAAKDTTINELSIGSRFSASNFIAEELVLTPAKARVVYGDHFDLVDGKVVGFDKPRGSAGRTALVDQHGNSVDFEVALRKVVDADPDKDHMIKSKVKSGAGSTSRAGGDVRIPDGKTDSLSRIAGGLAALKIGQ